MALVKCKECGLLKEGFYPCPTCAFRKKHCNPKREPLPVRAWFWVQITAAEIANWIADRAGWWEKW